MALAMPPEARITMSSSKVKVWSVMGCLLRAAAYSEQAAFSTAETERLRVFGESEFKGNLTAGRINIFGTMKVSGSLQFDRFNLKGLTEISGSMTGESCDEREA